MRIKSELDAVSDQGQILIKRYGSLSEFLIHDVDITIVDDYICLNSDTETARNLALSQIMEKTITVNITKSIYKHLRLPKDPDPGDKDEEFPFPVVEDVEVVLLITDNG